MRVKPTTPPGLKEELQPAKTSFRENRPGKQGRICQHRDQAAVWGDPANPDEAFAQLAEGEVTKKLTGQK